MAICQCLRQVLCIINVHTCRLLMMNSRPCMHNAVSFWQVQCLHEFNFVDFLPILHLGEHCKLHKYCFSRLNQFII